MKYIKTETGLAAFRDRSPLFSARQRSAFILFDGIKTAEEVLAATQGMSVSQADFDYLLAQGFLVIANDASPPRSQREKPDAATKQARYAMAVPIATRITASLGLRGFRLNLAVEAARDYDELLALVPKIKEAVGPEVCRPLELALRKAGSSDSGFNQR